MDNLGPESPSAQAGVGRNRHVPGGDSNGRCANGRREGPNAPGGSLALVEAGVGEQFIGGQGLDCGYQRGPT